MIVPIQNRSRNKAWFIFVMSGAFFVSLASLNFAQNSFQVTSSNASGLSLHSSIVKSSDSGDVVSEEKTDDPAVALQTADGPLKYYTIDYRMLYCDDPVRRRVVPAKVYYPLAVQEEPFPVIVFSHGLGGSFERCSYLGRTWSKRGFVVVLVQHPGSDENVWKGKLLIKTELKAAYQNNWSGRTRARDIRTVLDCLQQLTKSDHWLGTKLDMDRIGVGGYDLGCLASLLVSGQTPPDKGDSLFDPRIKAVLGMSPPVHPSRNPYGEIYGKINVPICFMTGTEDNGIIGSTRAWQRRIPFDSITQNDRYLIVFRGGDHQIYGGKLVSLPGRDDRMYQPAIARASTCFWLAYLKQDENSLEILADRRLNSVLGGLASVERRLSHEKTELPQNKVFMAEEDPPVKEDPALKSERPSGDRTSVQSPGSGMMNDSRKQTPEDPQQKSSRTNSTERKDDFFPITSYYQEVIQKARKRSFVYAMSNPDIALKKDQGTGGVRSKKE